MSVHRYLPILLLALMLVGCGGAPVLADANSLTNPTTAGEQVFLNGFNVTVDKASFDPDLDCSLGDCTPTEPNRYVAVTLSIGCSSRNCSFELDEWLLVDSDGEAYIPMRIDAGSVDSEPIMPLNNLQLTNEKRGIGLLAYDVPISGAPYVLLYNEKLYLGLPE